MTSDSFEIQNGKVRFHEDNTIIILLASALPISPYSPTELIPYLGFCIAGGLLYLAEKIRNKEVTSKDNSYLEFEEGEIYLYGEGDTIFLKAADRVNKAAPPAQLTMEEAAKFGRKLFDLALAIKIQEK